MNPTTNNLSLRFEESCFVDRQVTFFEVRNLLLVRLLRLNGDDRNLLVKLPCK